ncbi:hypothetical protein PHSY_001955 [Pseudozyma hubeiensis SY62]|uniref:Uncharacterized protein n=1 Tax=Pseudozyma hubeiensis (strain SY62) TaxID=1305764 RepID=R9P006_PSEHS|nr:hypothetical protein PHSY_001955 [Pseudozyma hubeiensis SY62]GAC94384.1 hypothetical protein PHSY_001955 [Pseudozyma hubeiensis SY62]
MQHCSQRDRRGGSSVRGTDAVRKHNASDCRRGGVTGRDRRKEAAICGEADKKDSRPSASFLSVDKVRTDKSVAPTEGGHDRFSAAMSETATRHGPDKTSRTSCLNSQIRDAMEKSQGAEFARQRQQGYERQSEAEFSGGGGR